MTSRTYGATEDILLAQLKKNLDAAREAGASWRVLAALIVGAAVPLSEILGELHPVDRIELRVFGEPEPQYIDVPRGAPEFWNGDYLTSQSDRGR